MPLTQLGGALRRNDQNEIELACIEPPHQRGGIAERIMENAIQTHS